MMKRWPVLIAITLLTAACARGGEDNEGAALTDTANSASITGDTATGAMSPTVDPALPTDTMVVPADTAATQGDSAALP